MKRAALVALLVLAAAADASANTRTRVVASGELAVTWRGDPALGCAERGVCDVAGSVVLTAHADQGVSESGGSQPQLEGFSVDLGQGAVRVVRGDLRNPAGVCVDAVARAQLRWEPRRIGGGRVRLVPQSEPFFGGISAGRCAGPLAADIEPALPRLVVPRASALREGVMRFDIRDRTRFVAGPFAGEVVPALRVRVVREQTAGRLGRDVDRPRRAGRRDRARARAPRSALLSVGYRIVRAEGALSSTFGGLPDPLCRPLDACGLTGTHELALAAPTPDRRLDLAATGPLSAVRARNVGGALAALRAGRLALLSGNLDGSLRARATVVAGREGVPPCRDERDIDLPTLVAHRAAGGLALLLGDRGFPGGDARDSRCPGPTGGEDPDGVTLATALIPVASIGAPELQVRLAATAPAPSADPLSATRRTGEIVLTLQRVGARFATVRGQL